MIFTKLYIEGLVIIEPTIWKDNRGHFFEAYNQQEFFENGIKDNLVQINRSFSTKGVLRGLHFQYIPKAQSKLVSCISGEIVDVAVDIRPNSPTYKSWAAVTLSSENKKMFYIPPGFLHGFCVLSDTAEIMYNCSALYNIECDGGVIWNDPDLAIEWPISNPILSEKDKKLPRLFDIQDRLISTIGEIK